jgi:hypothetical protein
MRRNKNGSKREGEGRKRNYDSQCSENGTPTRHEGMFGGRCLRVRVHALTLTMIYGNLL